MMFSGVHFDCSVGVIDQTFLNVFPLRDTILSMLSAANCNQGYGDWVAGNVYQLFLS